MIPNIQKDITNNNIFNKFEFTNTPNINNDNKIFIQPYGGIKKADENYLENSNHSYNNNSFEKELFSLYKMNTENKKDIQPNINKDINFSFLSPEKIKENEPLFFLSKTNKNENNKIMNIIYNNNNQNNKSFEDDNDDKKYNTDNTFIYKYNNNNIFDYIDKSDSNSIINSSTSPDIQNTEFNKKAFISRNKNNNHIYSSPKAFINKSIKKKKILNLKSFFKNNEKLQKISLSSNNNTFIHKFKYIICLYYKKYMIKEIIKSLINIKNNYKIQYEKIINRQNEKNKYIINPINNIIVSTEIKSINDNFNNNNKHLIKVDNKKLVHFSNNNNSYTDYFDQLSEKYNKEQEENEKSEYNPTNLSFVLNNFVNHTIFKNISKEFEKFKEYDKKMSLLEQNEIKYKIYTKYHGNIESIYEEDDESEIDKDSIINDQLEDINNQKDNLDSPMNRIINDFNIFESEDFINKKTIKINAPEKDNKKIIFPKIFPSITQIDSLQKIKEIQNSFLNNNVNNDNNENNKNIKLKESLLVSNDINNKIIQTNNIFNKKDIKENINLINNKSSNTQNNKLTSIKNNSININNAENSSHLLTNLNILPKNKNLKLSSNKLNFSDDDINIYEKNKKNKIYSLSSSESDKDNDADKINYDKTLDKNITYNNPKDLYDQFNIPHQSKNNKINIGSSLFNKNTNIKDSKNEENKDLFNDKSNSFKEILFKDNQSLIKIFTEEISISNKSEDISQTEEEKEENEIKSISININNKEYKEEDKEIKDAKIDNEIKEKTNNQIGKKILLNENEKNSENLLLDNTNIIINKLLIYHIIKKNNNILLRFNYENKNKNIHIKIYKIPLISYFNICKKVSYEKEEKNISILYYELLLNKFIKKIHLYKKYFSKNNNNTNISIYDNINVNDNKIKVFEEKLKDFKKYYLYILVKKYYIKNKNLKKLFVENSKIYQKINEIINIFNSTLILIKDKYNYTQYDKINNIIKKYAKITSKEIIKEKINYKKNKDKNKKEILNSHNKNNVLYKKEINEIYIKRIVDIIIPIFFIVNYLMCNLK